MLTDMIPDMARSGVSMRYFSPRYRKKDQKIVLRRQSMPSVRPPLTSFANRLVLLVDLHLCHTVYM